jgi:hypothetical protein
MYLSSCFFLIGLSSEITSSHWSAQILDKKNRFEQPGEHCDLPGNGEDGQAALLVRPIRRSPSAPVKQ